MTISSVAVQIPGFELIGDKGCIAYFVAYVIFCHGLAIAGFGMALMRLIWMEDRLSGLKYARSILSKLKLVLEFSSLVLYLVVS